MDNAQRELAENLLVQAVVVGLSCAVYLIGNGLPAYSFNDRNKDLNPSPVFPLYLLSAWRTLPPPQEVHTRAFEAGWGVFAESEVVGHPSDR